MEQSLSCRYLACHCYIKQGRYENALSLLGEENPTHLIATAQHNARRKLAHLNGNVARHVTQREKSIRGARDRIEYSEERERDREQEKELKYQAGMCYLRGLCFSKKTAFERAKDCFMTACRIDVQCFEAFDELMKHSLLSPGEEIQFLSELDFDGIRTDDPANSQEAAHLTKLLYTTRLSKYASPAAMTAATEDLASHYKLADNTDLLLTRAETLYTQCRFHEALAITTKILNSSPTSSDALDSTINPETTAALGHPPALYPLHLALLHETAQHNLLFHLSHTLSIHAPHESYTYLAIATYYLSTNRISESRRFFSKASLMDPHSAPAWIGFAHTFAAEGEHDQAIAAYSTAARLFQGNHLPVLFLGMMYIGLNEGNVGWEYCLAAYAMSSGSASATTSSNKVGALTQKEMNAITERIFRQPSQLTGDPLVINELGVILYHQNNFTVAAELFKRALHLAAELGCDLRHWVATRANLGHCLRRTNRLKSALREFDECLRVLTGGSVSTLSNAKSLMLPGASGTLSASVNTPAGGASGYEERNLLGSIHTARGLVLLGLLDRTADAVAALHEAVRVLGGDAGGGGVAATLLSRALEVWSMEQAEGDLEGEEHEDQLVDEGRAEDAILLAMPGKGRVRHGVGVGVGDEEDEDELEGESRREMIERGLDDDADGMLEEALGRL